MVERYVFVKLKEAYSTPEGRKETAARTLSDLESVPGIKRLIVGTPADESAEAAWDLSICVVFEKMDDVKPYLKHPEHRRYVDDFLKERMEVIKFWNFEVEVRDA